MHKPSDTPRTARCDEEASAGGKPSGGWKLHMREGRKVRQADVRKLRIGKPDAHLTTVGGLQSRSTRSSASSSYQELARRFGHLKEPGRGIVYPMGAQDAASARGMSVAGGQRVFDLEMLAADPLFVHLAGAPASPSIDVLYDDLRRFDPPAPRGPRRGARRAGRRSAAAPTVCARCFVDLDKATTVTPLAVHKRGAAEAPTPATTVVRKATTPILARIAQTGTSPSGLACGPVTRGPSGNSTSRTSSSGSIGPALRRASAALITMRIDAGGDCAPLLLQAIDGKGVWFPPRRR